MEHAREHFSDEQLDQLTQHRDMVAQKSMRSVVFVMSHGHSGSTMVDMIMDSHPDIFGLGEFINAGRLLDTGDKICGVCEGECPYWDLRASREILRRHFKPGRRLDGILHTLGLRSGIYEHLSRWFEASVLVDSSKKTWWIRRQLRWGCRWRRATPVLLFLTRDGRAVVNSFLRKYPERGIEQITNRWIQDTEDMIRLYNEFDGPKLQISYENLATNPHDSVRHLCQVLGITFEPNIVQFWNHEHHVVGGNKGTRSQVNRRLVPDQWHNGYYNSETQGIRLDLRWKHEMHPDSLAYFDAHAGKLNQPYRFDFESVS